MFFPLHQQRRQKSQHSKERVFGGETSWDGRLGHCVFHSSSPFSRGQLRVMENPCLAGQVAALAH
eukprot:1872234-Amphidinium_carterae.1